MLWRSPLLGPQPGGWGRAPIGETKCPNLAKKKSRHERASFGRKPADPKVGKMKFGIWLNKSCAMRTNPRRRAPLTHFDVIERGYSESILSTIVSTRI
jgi:hypothetical protein